MTDAGKAKEMLELADAIENAPQFWRPREDGLCVRRLDITREDQSMLVAALRRAGLSSGKPGVEGVAPSPAEGNTP
jgi:hypothetical protein